MSILIIGAAGFLGSSLAEHFTALGEEVTALSFRPPDRSSFLEQLEEAIRKGAPRAVINGGASQSGADDPAALEELILSNVFLPSTIASIMCKYAPEGIFINFGTSWQIGDSGESSPFNAYAASKSAVEPFLDHFALAGLRTVTLRLYDTYGPNDDRGKLINLISDALINKTELPMTFGEQLIDLIHVDDVIAAVDVVLSHLARENNGVHKIFALRSDRPVQVLEVLSLLKEATGLNEAPFIKLGMCPYRPRERFSLYADTPTPPGWRVRVSLKEGLSNLIAMKSLRAIKRPSEI